MRLGYATQVEEGGGRLSVGQRQLISFARALLADPRILILDEATSSVDTQTELIIQKALAHLLQGRTAFVIAHRLSTIVNADLIVVIDDGRIIEKGNHSELLAAGATMPACTIWVFKIPRPLIPARLPSRAGFTSYEETP